MAKQEISQEQSGRKMRTRDLIYAGAFGAIYLVLMLIIVLGSNIVTPLLYLFAPLTVGLVCGTVYMLCVLKVHKFGAALILGIMFAALSCMGAWLGMAFAILAALLAEGIIAAGKYKSKRMYLLSFVAFNLNMACPYLRLLYARDTFIEQAASYGGQAAADALAAVTPNWVWYGILGLAILGGIGGVLIASRLINKHFERAGIV
ncbi:MAG: MptD family putative ECF transporter S component [Clostridia bacterium]|nr:MptD family putative ECF transporter S component [Clostridia bacterium]